MSWSPSKRKAKLVEMGVTQQSIADGLDLTLGHVSQVVSGRRSPRVEKAVAELFKESVTDVFGPAKRRGK